MSYTYPEKFSRDNVIEPFMLLYVVIVTLLALSTKNTQSVEEGART